MSSGPEEIVGRAAELAQLDALLEGLAEGVRGCLALEGEPGIGKTRLLHELRARAEQRGQLVLAGSAAEFERDMPYGVWVEALDAYVASQDLSQHVAFDDELRRELALVLPSLRVPGEAASALGGERYRLPRAVRVLLGLIAADTPLVLALDDLHWADTGSIELIAALLSRAVESPVLLALAFRAGHAPAKLAASLAQPHVVTIRLEPLDEQHSAQLAGAELDVRRRAAIFAESGGNPLYTLQLARAAVLPPHSVAGAPDGGGIAVPGAVAAALAAEIDVLSPDAHTLLRAAAIAGDPFVSSIAFEIAQLDEEAGIAALDELLDVALLRPTAVPTRFAFRHPLVRRAVYEISKGGWRLLAHRRAAAALAAVGASPAAQAHHVEQSATPGDRDAIKLLLEAAQAADPQSPSAAARWYAAALRLMADVDHEERVATLTRLAAAQAAVGDHDRCCESLGQALKLVPASDLALRVRLTTMIASAETYVGRHGDARRRLAAIWDEIPARDSVEGVVALLARATAAFFMRDSADGVALAAAGLEAARVLQAPGLVGEAAATLSHMAAVHGDIPRAQSAHDEAAAALDSLADEELAHYIEAVHRLCRAELHLERFEDALRHAERGLHVARATGHSSRIPVLLSTRAQIALMLGRLGLAGESQQAGLEAARLAGNAYNLCAVLSTTASIALLRGEPDEALRAGQESVAVLGPAATGHMVGVAQAFLAMTWRELGASAAETEHLVEPLGGWDLPLLPAVWRVRHHEALTRIAAAAGDIEAADAAAGLAQGAAQELGLPLSTALAQRARAAFHLAEADPAEAARLAVASAQSAAVVGARVEAACSELLAGRALAALGERDEAVRVLRHAERELDECGARHPRSQARRELRKLGRRTEVRGPAAGADEGFGSLTAREREVAELVTDRRTNREIAAALYLSDKTIESHLRNIFVKLRCSSRVEVARAVEHERATSSLGSRPDP